MGGQSSGSQTVRNVTEVDPVTQAWRSNIMNRGNAIMGQGPAQYYPGSTVVPFSGQTQAGLNYLQSHAQQGAPGYGAAVGSAERALSGFNPGMGFAANMAQGGGSAATDQLRGFGGATNPALDSLWSQGSRQVADAVNGQFARAGRYGANAAHTGALTQGLGDLWGQVYAPAYEAERNRGLQAGQALLGREMAGADMLGSLWSQGNQDAARQQALLPGLFSYGQAPGQAMLDIGGMYEGQAQNYLDADRARYDYNANAGRNDLSWYANLMSGMPDFSNSTQTSKGPGTNRVMSGLGGALGGAGLAQSMGWLGAAGMTNPLGWAALGAGALGGLFG